MNKVRDTKSLTISSGRSLVVVDDLLLALLQQLAAMGLATSWEVRVNEPIEYEYTATKLMQRLAKKVLVRAKHGLSGD
jgi:hypothetical protein